MRIDRDFARELDSQDELSPFRDRFVIDDPDLIYLDGNSLGRLPRRAIELSQSLVSDGWGRRLIRGWNEGWMYLPERVGAKIAALIGAHPDEVIVADSTSVNLFKLAFAAVMARPERSTIVTDDLNFPSDLYVLDAVAKSAQPRRRVAVVDSPDGVHGPVEGIAQALDTETALLSLTQTVYKTAYCYDMAALTQMAHDCGALVLWDLSHAAGSVPVQLNAARADLAVGCTYKYLNAGPGAPAFLYVRRDLQEQLGNPITGWMGRADMFHFQPDYEPHPGIRRFVTGTPPILSMAMIEPGVDLLLEAGMDRLRAKSLRQTGYLIELYDELLKPLGFALNTPRDPTRRGSHVTLTHAHGWQIDQALIHEARVIPDFRRPNHIRLGIAPIYTSFSEIHEAVLRLCSVVEQGLYQKYDPDRAGVT